LHANIGNALVASLRYAEHEIKHGRRGSVQSALTDLLLDKKLTGVAAIKARERAEKDAISQEEAARRNRIDQAKASAHLKYTKSGRFLKTISTRKLAVAYALESVEATRKKKGGCCSPVAVALTHKFQDACNLYVSGKRGVPRFKRRADSISLQYQVKTSSPDPIVHYKVRLDKLAGKVCEEVPLILHRPIPDGATIKQVALTIRGPRLFAVFMLDIVGHGRQYPSTGRIAGVDPGRKMALSLASLDGNITQIIQPPLARDKHVLRRLRRLQRKAERQLRVANPECFKAYSTFKRGHRPTNKSANFLETSHEVLEIQEHIANARRDYYHNAANQMLTDYDVIGVGSWRGNGKAPGKGKAKRAQARKDYDHAISTFTQILKYKADESGKIALTIPERGSTKTCSHCGASTGPTGLEGLKIRNWTCHQCGAEHNRDFQAAANIAKTAKQMAAGSADGVASLVMRRKKGRRAKAQTQVVPKSAEVPVDDQALNREAGYLINAKYSERCKNEPETGKVL
jgi:transposase